MTRITPRTCLWPITFTLLATFALSIGLTFRSNHHCYAGTCGEWLFPLQARLHVLVWYLWITTSVAWLGLRAFHPQMRRVLQHHLLQRKLPWLGKHLNVSGLLIVIWILLLYGAVVRIWWLPLRDYFEERGVLGGVTDGNYKLAAIALTGHVCDITMGMVLLPISRHSALASFFKLSVSTTLAFHMVQAYVLFALVLIHGSLYVSWIPVFNSLSMTMRTVYPVLNPTYLYHEAWPGNTGSLGIWRASLPFTGLFTTVIMVLVFFTTLPGVRGRYFNVFYFTHLAIIVGVVVICLHASTMFYCTAPGLVLWLVDWAMRIYELWSPVDGRVTTIGKGYYVLDMTMPRNRLDGCACTSPLAHFYIYHSDSSSRELHPFTTVTHLASENARTPPEELDLRIQFLFRKRSNKQDQAEIPKEEQKGTLNALRALARPKRKRKIQWTEKLASHADASILASTLPASEGPIGDTLAEVNELEKNKSRQTSIAALGDSHSNPIIDVALRLEGPYFTPADPARYRTTICLVAGTGISGGIAIANAFIEMQRQRAEKLPLACPAGAGAKCVANAASGVWERCVVIWSVREEDFIEMPFLTSPTPGLEVHHQFTGKGRKRIDFSVTLSEILKPATTASGPSSRTSDAGGPKIGDSSTWVYLSGPNAFITTGEKACQAGGVDFYGARWEI